MWLTKEVNKRMAQAKEQAQALRKLRPRWPRLRTKGSLPADFGGLCRIWGLDATDSANLSRFVRARRREAVFFGITAIVCGADVLWGLRGRPLAAGVILAVSGVAFVYIITVKLWQAACVREKRYTIFRAWWLGQRPRDQ